jgi:RNA polymerase sigma-70 factor, ECF subfamily
VKRADPITDEALMLRFQCALDDEAFEEIVSRYLTPAVGTARQILSDPALAEDAAQEAFLRVVRKRKQYRPGKRFSSWFYTILRNICRDMLRKQARQKALVREVAARQPAGPAAPPSDSPDAVDLLSILPPDARAVVNLRIAHGLSFRDVAAALGISEEAAKKRAQRALQRLREANARTPDATVGRRVSDHAKEYVPRLAPGAYSGTDRTSFHGNDLAQ